MGKVSSLFNGAGEQTLYKRVTPSTEQREFLQLHWNALADHLKASLSATTGYAISTWIQGSYKYGTLIRPVRKGDEYDVDVGIYFEWEEDGNATPSALQLREWVQRELESYWATCNDIRKIEVPPKERCSRAVYSGQFHIDTPVYHLERSRDRRRLACLSGEWEDSDPKSFYKWFKNALDSGDREQVRRLVRYLKGWAALAFEDVPTARPSSILLTVLVVDAFNKLWLPPFSSLDDDDLLLAVVKSMHDRLCIRSIVQNPVDSRENLNRISAEMWDPFITRLKSLRDAAERAEDANDEATAALAWSEAFAYLMPLPLAESVEVVDETSGGAVLLVPEIDIEVFADSGGPPVGSFRNEVTSVAKGRKLIFRIRNPAVIPEYATIEWTVRNEGVESDAIGDLGHRRIGVKMFSTDERTTYAGVHHMDCIIRVHGQVFAVRRVPVIVKDVRYPPRNPAKPAYAKLRSILRTKKRWI